LFSNNCIGAVFNDNTKIIGNPQFSQIQYISSRKNGEQISVYGISEFPQELYKKVMLLHLFKKQFMYDEKGAYECSDGLRAYLKKWLITPHAMIFRISNKVIQICFRDGTELLLSSQSKHLTYVDKQKNMCSHQLSSALETGNKELIKRLKYSKEVLVKMLKNDDKE
jgi:polo-like kinase 1